jgi:hypothetical protein
MTIDVFDSSYDLSGQQFEQAGKIGMRSKIRRIWKLHGDGARKMGWSLNKADVVALGSSTICTTPSCKNNWKYYVR